VTVVDSPKYLSVPLESASLPALDAALSVTAAGPDDGTSRWIAAFLALWAIVASAAFARRFAGWRALSHSLSGAHLVTDADALARFDELCRRAGVRRSGRRAAVLSVAPHLASPVTRGLLVPEICLPPRALRDLDADEFDALLGHEIAHAARSDPAWLAVFRLLEVVFCLQPLNRVVARRIEDDAELLCDDRAVVWTGDRLPLASCLTEVASWLVPGAREPRLAVGMAAHGARLSRRVERLVDEEHRPDAGARHPLLTAGAIVFAASAVAVVPGFAAQRSAKPLPFGLRLELALASTPTPDTDSSSDAVLGPEGLDEHLAALALGAPPDGAEAATRSSATGSATSSASGSATGSAAGSAAGSASGSAAGSATGSESGSATSSATSSVTTGVMGSAPSAETPKVSALASPLTIVLDELVREIDTLRARLHERAGGLELERDLDALARRVGELRAREADLVKSLARTSIILLSPDVAGRSAEDQ